MSDWIYDGKSKFTLLDDDDVMDAPITDEDVVEVFTKLFKECNKWMPLSFTLENEGGDRYTLRPKNPKRPVSYFDSLTINLTETDDSYLVTVIPDYYIRIVSLCSALGLSVEDGPEGFADIKNYGVLEEHLEDTTDKTNWEFIIKKSKI